MVVPPDRKTRLKHFFDRLKLLDEEKKTLTTDINGVLKEAKGENFDPKILRKMLSRRNKTKTEIEMEESLITEYEDAVTE